MSPELAASLGLVAPYYNLVMVLIVILLFLKLFKINNNITYIKPWKFLFYAVLIYVIEEIVTVLESAKLITVSPLIFPLFELIIIGLFIYVLLLQKEFLVKKKK